MNLSAIRTWLDAHQTPVLVTAAGGVGGLALYVRHKNASGATSTAGATTATPAIAGLDGSPNTASTDLQNEVQDEINTQFSTLQQQLTDQLAKITKPPATTTPPPPAKKPLPLPPGKTAPPITTGKTTVPRQTQYTVVHGDNLSKIAASHGISLSQIEKLNPQIKNFNLIYSGQKVNLS